MAKITRTFTDFNGMNDTSSVDNLLPTELRTAQNLTFKSRGGYINGPGRVRVNASGIDANPVKTLIPFRKKNGTTIKLYSSGTGLWKDNGNGTYSNLINTLAGPVLDWFPWTDDKLYFLDGTNYYRTDGTTVEVVSAFSTDFDLTGIKKCKCHEFYPLWFRHFWGGDSSDPYCLYYADDSDPTKGKSATSGAAAFNKVYPVMNMGYLKSIDLYRDSILIGYEFGFMKWTGGGTNPVITANWRLVKASNGPVSNNATTIAREMFVYAATDGVYVLESTDPTAEDNSRKISKDIDNLYSTLTDKSNMSAFFDGRFLYLSSPADGIVLMADFDSMDEEGNPAWSYHTQCTAYSFMNINNVVHYGSNNGLIMKFDPDNYDNDGQFLPMKAVHHFKLADAYGNINPFAQHKIKALLLAVVEHNAGSNCKVTIKVNYETVVYTMDLTDSLVWGDNWGDIWGQITYSAKEAKIGEKGSRLTVTIENTQEGQPIEILGIGIKYRPATKSKGNKNNVVKVG